MTEVFMSRIPRLVSAVCTAGLVLACDGPTEGLVPSIALTLESAQAAATQGSIVAVGLSISRTHFDEPVALRTGTLPVGVSVTFDPAVIPAGTTTSTVTVAL